MNNEHKLTRTQRMLDMIKHPLLGYHQDDNNIMNANHEKSIKPNNNEQTAFIELIDSGEASEENNDIPLKGDLHAINILSNILLSSGAESNTNEALKKEKEQKFTQKVVPIAPNLDENSSDSSSDSNSSSDSISSDSDLSAKSDSSKNSLPDPFGSDDSCKDPTYNAPPPDNRGNTSSENEQDAPPRTKKRKIKDHCETEKTAKKRKRNVDNWTKNVAKRLRNSGESYVSKSVRKNEDGTKTISKATRPAKSLKPPCGMKWKLKCSEKITLDERTKIFNEYWNLKNVEKQREFISSNIQTVNPKYKYSNREEPRNPNNAYCFLIQQKRVRVCKYFFMATLDINHRVISTILKKQSVCESSNVVESDKRGKHRNHKRLDENIKNGVRNHIQSIPRIESHYCRSHSSKEYIEGDKTIADLHRDYVTFCKEQKLTFANYFMYSKIFNEEFNLAFHLPKKDQCELCLQYRNSDDQQKLEIEEKYNRHVKEKGLSRKLKEDDKNSDDKTKVIVFDLQAVLPCPTGEASSFYYVSKLNVLNFTLYDLKTKEGTCFLWHEGEAHRGANEIGSCVLKYLREMAQQTQGDFSVVFYSDDCAGQNKNKFLIAMYMYALSLGITSITHNFFVTGHGQSEGDSMHAMIEKQVKKFKRSSPIYAPDQYACIIRAAKKNGKPYKVNELCHNDFVDLKALAADLFINIPKNVKLTEIRALKLDKDHPNVMFFKTSFEQSDYSEAPITNSRRKNVDLGKVVLKDAYNRKPGITDAKKNGLLSLIQKKRCVPMYYLDFYKDL